MHCPHVPATTRGRYEDSGVGETLHQLDARRHLELEIVIDEYRNVAARNELRSCRENDHDQHENDRCEQGNTQTDLDQSIRITVQS